MKVKKRVKKLKNQSLVELMLNTKNKPKKLPINYKKIILKQLMKKLKNYWKIY